MKLLNMVCKRFNINTANETTQLTDIALTRPELRFIEKYIVTKLQMLLMSVVPGYEARINKAGDEEARANYQSYLDKANKSIEDYKEILRKTKELL